MVKQNRLNAIFLMGATGTGKSAVALRLAKNFPLEIINVDSVQVYKDLHIGSAKPTPFEQRMVPHHLIDICEINEIYSAARFCEDAKKVSSDILSRKKIPLFVGGTGLYFKSFASGLSSLPKSDPDLREQLLLKMRKLGLAKLHEWLTTLDARSAKRINPNDTQRVLRALEVCLLAEKPMSAYLEEGCQGGDLVDPLKFVLFKADRKLLRDHLRERFQQMLNRGLINEVINLTYGRRPEDIPNCLKSVGYKEVLKYLLKELSYDEMIFRASISTGQLAKRQDTWFKREKDGFRLESSNHEALFEKIIQEIEKAGIFRRLP